MARKRQRKLKMLRNSKEFPAPRKVVSEHPRKTRRGRKRTKKQKHYVYNAEVLRVVDGDTFLAKVDFGNENPQTILSRFSGVKNGIFDVSKFSMKIDLD